MVVTVEDVNKARLENLCLEIPPIFQEAQTSVANHRKNCVALYKLHLEAEDYTTTDRKGQTRATGRKKFRVAFLSTFVRIFQTKKGDGNGDRISKFVGMYIKHINEKCQSYVTFMRLCILT
jgi:condensin complex subunit 3